MKTIDAFLNKITMYRLVMLGLFSLAVISIFFAFMQWMPFTALQLSLSLVVLLVAAWLSNKVFALFAHAAPSFESSLITALILFFICAPLHSVQDGLILAGLACVAMLSKYVLAINKRHIFNPAAFAAFVASVVGTGSASWWVATPILFPFTLVLGLLVVRKIRRFDAVLTFVVVASATFAVRLVLSSTGLGTGFQQFVLSWPLVFFSTIMLIEPQTMPPMKSDRIIYGTIVGLLYSLAFTIGPVSATPEFALLIGNIYAFIIGFPRRVILTLKEVNPLTRDIFEFVFLPNKAFSFIPGQYAEWTLLHRGADARGVRRYFTIASAPEDPFIRLGMRVPVEGSSFKARLRSLAPGASISMSSLAGEFILPKNPNEKIAAIAGGIGITPFMSMFRHLAERHEHRDMVLIYAAASPLDFAYQEELDSMANAIGLTVIYLPTDFTELTSWSGESGYVTEEIIKKYVPQYKDRTWYLSGPDAMVQNYKHLVRAIGIQGSRIKSDYFPGL